MKKNGCADVVRKIFWQFFKYLSGSPPSDVVHPEPGGPFVTLVFRGFDDPPKPNLEDTLNELQFI